MKNIRSENNWTLSTTFIFLGYNIRKKELKDAFCSGNFKFDFNKEEIKERISRFNKFFKLCKKKRVTGHPSFKGKACVRAFIDFTENKKIDWNKFCYKLDQHHFMLGRRYSKDEFIEMFLDMYNRGSSCKLRNIDL